MRLEIPPKILFLLDFCRKNNSQQIRIGETNEEELKNFIHKIFYNKKMPKGKAEVKDGTTIYIRCINIEKKSSVKVAKIHLYNISPTQARVYTIKCIKQIQNKNK